jgi:predicted SAM-dependent methyltransferase
LRTALFAEKDFPMKLGRLASLLSPAPKQPIPTAAEAARTAALFEELGNPGFVCLAYLIVMQRGIDPVGYDHFVPRLERKQMTRSDVINTLIDSDEYRARCLMMSQILHQSRKQVVRQLPKANIIVDLGGTCLDREEGALFVMGYPYQFDSLSIVDLPPAKRHKSFADEGTEYRRIVETKLGPVRYVYTSMADLSAFADDSVDLVYSGQSIEHVTRDDATKVCREAYRILKPGGWFCLDTPNRALTRLQFRRRFINPDHKHEYTHAELSGLLEQSGFSIRDAKGLVLLQQSARQRRFLEAEFRQHGGAYDDIENCYLLYYRCIKP